MTPTDYAKVHLNNLKHFGDRASKAKTEEEFRTSVGSAFDVLGYALEEMATGLRATYILLDQVNQKLDRIEKSRRV
jgi:hypothetical protein